MLAELGVIALKRASLEDLLENAVRLGAEGLEAELCKVLEYQPRENRLLMVAGVGWDPGLVGTASVGADLESPSGFALKTGKPVISNHLEIEERFRTPDLLKVHGVRRAINVILQGDGAPFGVLEVDSRSPGEFSEHDIAFLQGAANILGMAIERQRYERNLRGALQHQKVLVGEINHRVKNSLQLVASLFSLQAAGASDPALAQSLQEAVGRVTAVARIHEPLYRSPRYRFGRSCCLPRRYLHRSRSPAAEPRNRLPAAQPHSDGDGPGCASGPADDRARHQCGQARLPCRQCRPHFPDPCRTRGVGIGHAIDPR